MILQTIRDRGRGPVVATVLVLAAMLAAVMQADPSRVVQADHLSSSAWLPFDSAGVVALFDGAVPGQAALVAVGVAGNGSPLDVAPDRRGVLALDRTASSITRIDGATWRALPAVDVLPAAFGRARLVTGAGGDVWVERGGWVQRVRPEPLTAVGPPTELPGDAGPDLVVAEGGRLWMADGGEVVALGVIRPAARMGPGVRLGSVDDRLVALDPDADRLVTVADGRSCPVEVSEEAVVQRTATRALITDPGLDRVYIVGPHCELITLAAPADMEPGSVVEADGWFYLVDDRNQRVWVIQANDDPRAGWTEPLSGDTGSPVRLVVGGGIVYFNQPATTTAGVLRPGVDDGPTAISLNTAGLGARSGATRGGGSGGDAGDEEGNPGDEAAAPETTSDTGSDPSSTTTTSSSASSSDTVGPETVTPAPSPGGVDPSPGGNPSAGKTPSDGGTPAGGGSGAPSGGGGGGTPSGGGGGGTPSDGGGSPTPGGSTSPTDPKPEPKTEPVDPGGTEKPVCPVMPALVGGSKQAALDTLKAAGITDVITMPGPFGNQVEPQVAEQTPAAGAAVCAGTQVKLIITKNPPVPPMPDVVGKTEADARAALAILNTTITVTQEASATVAAGKVIGQDPLPGVYPTQPSVTIVVSTGPPPPQNVPTGVKLVCPIGPIDVGTTISATAQVEPATLAGVGKTFYAWEPVGHGEDEGIDLTRRDFFYDTAGTYTIKVSASANQVSVSSSCKVTIVSTNKLECMAGWNGQVIDNMLIWIRARGMSDSEVTWTAAGGFPSGQPTTGKGLIASLEVPVGTASGTYSATFRGTGGQTVTCSHTVP